ncbi:MAG: PQQ-dependent sugar dehydrogenase [Daejeonella sp.]
MKITPILFFALIFCSFNCGKTKEKNTSPPVLTDAQIDIKVLTENLSHVWEIAWGTDNQLWITERGGKISRVDPQSGQINPVFTIPDVKSTGEGGLLGMALHPDFKNNPYVFVSYNYDRSGSYREKIVRFTYSGGTLTDPKILLDNIPANSFHNGSRLAISKDQKLFFSTGDAGDQPAAQNVNSVSGKILRLNLDGTIPSDNPISGNPVWSFGHRNPQGLVFVNDKLYSSEHGPDSDDEINLIEKNRNYGWPDVKGFCDKSSEKTFCEEHNVVEPLFAWTPTLAVSGLKYYDNDLIPQWKNSLLLATLKDNTFYQLQLNADGNKIESVKEIFRGTYGRLRGVCVAPDGKVYVSTSNGSNDKIIVISKKN